MDYKKEYELLKEKVVENYDYWLLKHILIDFEELGKIEYLIGEHDEFLYNVELSRELKEIIDHQLAKEHNQELIIKFLELKKTVDKRIIENSFYDEIYVNEYIFDVKKDELDYPHYKHIIQLSPNITNKKKVLKEIFIFLKNEKIIYCSEKEFVSHFEPSKNWEAKIQWNKNLISLIGLIEFMFVYDILPKYHKRKLRNKIILNHFTKEDGDLKLGSIKTLASELNLHKDCKPIKEFIASLNT